jgi:hypothetical protein
MDYKDDLECMHERIGFLALKIEALENQGKAFAKSWEKKGFLWEGWINKFNTAIEKLEKPKEAKEEDKQEVKESALINLLNRYPQYQLNKWNLAQEIRQLATEKVEELQNDGGYDGCVSYDTVCDDIKKALSEL